MCLACVVIICFITTQAEICKYLAFFGKSLQDFTFFVKIGEILKLAIAKRICKFHIQSKELFRQ